MKLLEFFKKLITLEEYPDDDENDDYEEYAHTIITPEREIQIERSGIDFGDVNDVNTYLRRLRDRISESKLQLTMVGTEYDKVTRELKDIQLIEGAPDDIKLEIIRTAEIIEKLNDNRNKARTRVYKFSDEQRNALERFDEDKKADIEKLKEFEEYQIQIKHDLEILGKEKKLVKYEMNDIRKSQSALKLISKIFSVFVAMFAVVLMVIMYLFQVDARIPFIAGIIFVAFILMLIMYESRTNKKDMALAGARLNKTISLTNHTKIRYVNTTNAIDYLCYKYKVDSSEELEMVSDQYQRAMREFARQREDAFILDDNSQKLIDKLGLLGVDNKEIWVNRTTALLNPNEMVEIKHALNGTRGGLRKRMEYYNDLIERANNEIMRYVKA